MKTSVKGVELLKTGRYRASVGSGKSRVAKTFATEERAIAFRLGSMRAIADGEFIPGDGLTLAVWGQTWLRSRGHLRSAGNDRQRWESHVATARFAALPLVAIEPRHIRAWLVALTAKGLAFRTRKNCRTVLSVAFRDAKRDGLVPSNPCEDVRVEGELPPVSDDWYLTPDEQRELLAAIPGAERWFIAFAMATGLRRGELFALHLRDVHLDEDHPHVMVKYGGWSKGGVLKTPKNRKSRKVALVGLALEAMHRWLAALPSYAPCNPHDLVFPCPSGARRVYSRDVPAAFHVAKKKIKRVKVWFHLLRHTCASSLVAGWWGAAWSLEEVCKFLGHSSIAVTERYAHLAPSRLDEKASRTMLLTVLPEEGDKPLKLLSKALSRPGDLKPEPAPQTSPVLPDREHPVSIAALRALRAYLSGDPTATRQMASVLISLLPEADTAGLGAVGGA